MKVGLIDVDSKIPNLALMKISSWHKAQGDQAEMYMPLWKYDKVYASKVFDFSEAPELPDGCITGGTGYDLLTVLPNDVEYTYPDYGLYRCDYAMGFITRGCNRKCRFCVVPQKEGRIARVADLVTFWQGQRNIMLLDNNLTAHPDCVAILEELRDSRAYIDFSQGLDLRLVTIEMARVLAKMRLWKRIHTAWDDIKQEKLIKKGIDILVDGGVSVHKLMSYVLIGFNSTPEEDYYRVMKLREWGVGPFVMPYDKHDRYQGRFARWVNRYAIFKSVKWEDYNR